MFIAVDAMGSDVGPSVVVPGAVSGARQHGVDLFLVGREPEVAAELAKVDTRGVTVEVVHASELIEMEEHAANAVRRKKDSSVTVALSLVKEGRAGAMFSAGHSGATMAAALMVLGRIKGIDRPAIAGTVPTVKGGRALMLDIGAVTDPKPITMVQNALMGDIYAREVMGLPSPTIGLMSIGEEDSKGNQFTIEVNALLRETPGIRFHGNIEGRDILQGTVDICVMDGFTGNIVLKTIEGTGMALMHEIRQEVTATAIRKLGAMILKPAFRTIARKMDPDATGGAPLLGVNGNALIGHGASTVRAIENAVAQSAQAASRDVAARIAERIARQPSAADA